MGLVKPTGTRFSLDGKTLFVYALSFALIITAGIFRPHDHRPRLSENLLIEGIAGRPGGPRAIDACAAKLYFAAHDQLDRRGVAAIVVFWGLLTFNGLVRRKNLVAEAWRGIETQLKRRADLIPNLVETVKGYAAHERGTFDELTKLRSAEPGTQRYRRSARQTEAAITAAIGKIMAVAEAYPDLKASANFQSLQKRACRYRRPDPAGAALLQRRACATST